MQDTQLIEETESAEENWTESDADAPREPRLLYPIAAFLIGLLGSFTVRLVGLMPLSEIVLLGICAHALLFLAFVRRWPATVPAPRLFTAFLVCEAVALAGYILSDLYRGSSTGDMMRGWSRMVFLAFDLVGLALLFGRSWKNFALVQLGVCCSFVEPLLHGAMFGDYWKFGFGVPVTIFILMLSARLFGGWGAVLACLGLAGLHVVLDFRSMGMLCVGTGALLSLRALPRQVRKLALIVAALAVLAAVPRLADSIINGASDRANRSNVERSAMMQAAWEGFAESPLIGYGSWFSNSDIMDRFLAIRTMNAQLSQAGGFDETDAESMAIHSQILVSLAEGGLFGAAFFYLFGAMLVWGIWALAMRGQWSALTPVLLFVLLTAFWDFWFSPFSGAHRVNIALAAVIVLRLWSERGESALSSEDAV